MGDGSSPYTRGTQILCVVPARICRFIPVHTGNSASMDNEKTPISVHPRTHGELNTSFVPFDTPAGSSPYTRGTLEEEYGGSDTLRFIPVHTGNSSRSACILIILSVHPRTHGELLKRSNRVLSHYGSSPYTRGTPGAVQSLHRSLRFIPVHTGNS